MVFPFLPNRKSTYSLNAIGSELGALADGMNVPACCLVAAANTALPRCVAPSAARVIIRAHLDDAPMSRKLASIDSTMALGVEAKEPGSSITGMTAPWADASHANDLAANSSINALLPAPGTPWTTTVWPFSPSRTPSTALFSNANSSSRPAKTVGAVQSLVLASRANDAWTSGCSWRAGVMAEPVGAKCGDRSTAATLRCGGAYIVSAD